jgi:hypothetical protein
LQGGHVTPPFLEENDDFLQNSMGGYKMDDLIQVETTPNLHVPHTGLLVLVN